LTVEDAPVRAAAPAKVNLYLHVLGRRADGFHLLDSLVVFAGIGDEVSCEPAADLTLRVEGRFAAALGHTTDNLVLRAARLLQAATGSGKGAALVLRKNLPVAAGLGGGSADAAAALGALSRLWGVELGEERLARLGLEMGADVPVCLAGRPCFVGGIGDALEPAPALPAAHLVLANPGVALATATVFAARAGAYSEPARWREPPADAAALARLIERRRNDLAQAARRFVPGIDAVLAALAAAPGCLVARMSGSGATCFGLFASPVAAAAAAQAMAEAAPDWWVAAAPLLSASTA